MNVNWRKIHAARNSFAALSAACEQEGFLLVPVDQPAADVTCYSLNSLNEPFFRDEITGAECITIVGGPHATACPGEVAEYADYVITGEGEFTLPRLLTDIEQGWKRHYPRCDNRSLFPYRLYQLSGSMPSRHFLKNRDTWRSQGAVRLPAGIARLPRSSGIACDTVRSMQ